MTRKAQARRKEDRRYGTSDIQHSSPVKMISRIAAPSCRPQLGALRLAAVKSLRPVRGSRIFRTQAALFDTERQAEIRYFDARGAAETTRMLFAAANMPFKDVRYTIAFGEGGPKVEDQHATDKEAGVFAANLNRLPLLILPGGETIGQSKAMERTVAKELGFFGSNEVETAQIDCYCEHVRDIREAYGKAVGSPFAPPSPDAEEKINKWFDEDMPNWMTRLEKVTGAGGHAVGGTASLADIVLFSLMTEGIKDVERATAACSECLNIQAVLARVEEMEGIKIWKENRPDTKF